MALSRKQKRELARFKGQASDLWDDQKDVLDRANKVVRDAQKQARIYAREEVAPRARDAFEDHVKPAVASGASAVASGASAMRDRAHDAIPAASSAFGSALALLEVAKDQNVRDALKRVQDGSRRIQDGGRKAAQRAGVVKPSNGPGRYILIGIGVVALVGVAYVAWQTLRADDDLWIDDEDVTEPDPEGLPS